MGDEAAVWVTDDRGAPDVERFEEPGDQRGEEGRRGSHQIPTVADPRQVRRVERLWSRESVAIIHDQSSAFSPRACSSTSGGSSPAVG
jgi:hypothetical protein